MAPRRKSGKISKEKGIAPSPKAKKALRDLRKSYSSIKDPHAEMGFRLALMSEVRDSTTGGHLVRIADYSALIAEGMGLSSEEIKVIRFASPMHDVGKVMTPEIILEKNGSLTESEKKCIRKHPQVGADIFKGLDTTMMRACALVAASHHERYDGKGYPKGLKGNKIPLYGRIVALADCFDAYTMERPYKKAYSFDKAVDMIKERSGTHFDPSVVDAFLKNIRKARKIWEANRDIRFFVNESVAENGGSNPKEV